MLLADWSLGWNLQILEVENETFLKKLPAPIADLTTNAANAFLSTIDRQDSSHLLKPMRPWDATRGCDRAAPTGVWPQYPQQWCGFWDPSAGFAHRVAATN
jgi:hypothetical protein